MKKLHNQSMQKVFIKDSKAVNCNVSNASNEIMLNRIFNGKRLEFPFSNCK